MFSECVSLEGAIRLESQETARRTVKVLNRAKFYTLDFKMLPHCSCDNCWTLSLSGTYRLHPPPALHRALPGLHGGEERRVCRRHLRDHEADPGSQSHPQHLQDDRVSPAGHLRLP